MATDKTIRRPQKEPNEQRWGKKGAASDVNQTYRETDTVTELNISYMNSK